MNNKKLDLKYGVVALMIFVAALSRLLPHPPNFTPVAGMALFGAAYFNKRWLAIVIPLIALWCSNLILDNVFYAQYYDGFVWFSAITLWVYVSIAIVAVVGFLFLRKRSVGRIAVATLSASILFFLITNFGSWMSAMSVYPKTFSGLMACYAAGIPFFWKTMAGDFFYVAVLFGTYEWVKQSVPSFRTANA
ncbi:MAG: DUF6580 family putative transport protein [Bacteroidota bacterium]